MGGYLLPKIVQAGVAHEGDLGQGVSLFLDLAVVECRCLLQGQKPSEWVSCVDRQVGAFEFTRVRVPFGFVSFLGRTREFLEIGDLVAGVQPPSLEGGGRGSRVEQGEPLGGWTRRPSKTRAIWSPTSPSGSSSIEIMGREKTMGFVVAIELAVGNWMAQAGSAMVNLTFEDWWVMALHAPPGRAHTLQQSSPLR